MAYPLVDLKRLSIYVKEYVYRLEHCVLKTLEAEGVTGHRFAGAPGVYVRLADPFGHAAVDPRPPRERCAPAMRTSAPALKATRAPEPRRCQSSPNRAR